MELVHSAKVLQRDQADQAMVQVQVRMIQVLVQVQVQEAQMTEVQRLEKVQEHLDEVQEPEAVLHLVLVQAEERVQVHDRESVPALVHHRESVQVQVQRPVLERHWESVPQLE
mmetsp:Transcript_27633/g.45548  ORF Transcript_27633/g.45548 Transcript_27633/m.45548 type:complete len:113 (+) Transcript_27633:167-505(+)